MVTLEKPIISKIKPAIGAVVNATKHDLLRGQFSSEIRQTLELCGVVAFPQVHFTDEEQVAFTKLLGTFAPEMHGDILKISLDKRVSPTAEYFKGAFYWHIDGTMQDIPIFASLMSARVLSPTGGNTEFCNTYAAYDALPDSEKQMLEEVRVVHSFYNSQLYVNPEPSYSKLDEWMALGTKELPLVWKHRSGRKSLVLGSTAQYVVGMEIMESTRLLCRLRDWATQEQFSYSHVWSLGDAVLWDNTGTMHRAMAYPVDSGREMHRTRLAGEEPFA